MINHEEEPEPYILTKDDEERLVKNKIKQLRDYAEWKLRELGFSEMETMKKMSEINWEESFDKNELLRSANSIRHQENWHKEQREKERTEEEDRKKIINDTWTAKYFFRWMKSTSQIKFGKKLIVNEFNTPLITALCYFLSEDKRFETDLGYSPKKGLLIRGISGIGKTHLVKCVEDNQRNPIKIFSMLEITDEIKREGQYEIDMGDKKIIYLDDVGTEEHTVKHYGTSVSFFKNFIELVYLKYEGKTFNRLMMSTNNSFSELEEKYGFRVRSRLKDMFNIVDVKGSDMRG